ncbi:MAG: thiamine-phosphate kinase [Brevinema sp.]
MKQKRLSESSIIEELTQLFKTHQPHCVGIGDDAAIIDRNTLIATDAMVEGVHFLREKASWSDVAYKLLASNASDMAAMGGYPTSYTLALSLPEYWETEDFDSFVAGAKSFLETFSGDLVGGDLVRSKEFFASVTVLGRSFDQPILRTTAQVGDYIYCTGTLGDSRLWLKKELDQEHLPMSNEEYFKARHYRPTPRIEWMKILSQSKISAAMDISDGLVEDLQKLCKSSAVSFELYGDLVPLNIIEIGRENFEQNQISYQKEALIGGEDYEILFTSAELLDEEFFLKQGVKITKIGQIKSQNTQPSVLLNNKIMAVDEFAGFKH